MNRVLFSITCVVGLTLGLLLGVAEAQSNADGMAAAKRLEAGKEGKSTLRGGVEGGVTAVVQNMKRLFEKILIENVNDGDVDKWYEPHLRDIALEEDYRQKEVFVRANTAPYDNMARYCTGEEPLPNGEFTIQAACPLKAGFVEICRWHGDPYSAHRPEEACYSPNTTAYAERLKDSNFKYCCVPERFRNASSEQIAAAYPRGDGWAGLFEYYYPTSVVGWENERGTTQIVDKQKVSKCIQESDALMEGAEAQDWVANAIARNIKTAGGSANESEIKSKVQEVISKVRPQDKDLRFTDSLQGEGLTMRVNLAAMEEDHRKLLAKRFCMREEQFHKLMKYDPSGVNGDPLQLGPGGLSAQELDANIPVWANYCKEGVELMAQPRNSSELVNPDGTPTELNKGMELWTQDPLYCQRMNLSDPNMALTRIGEVINKVKGGGAGSMMQAQQASGNTCLLGSPGLGQGVSTTWGLNGGMVPVALYRHAAIERRVAIADHVLGFVIAGGIFNRGMRQGQRSYYKRFEPQAYSNMSYPKSKSIFKGKPFKGPAGATNEEGKECYSLGTELAQYSNKSDRMYISNETHQYFTQEPIDDANPFSKYRWQWAKNQNIGKDIAKKGLDDKANNYGAMFRLFATCPAGFVRWQPPDDKDNEGMIANLNRFCGEENFGGND